MWLATLACVAVALLLTFLSWRQSGRRIVVSFLHGHGVEPGAPVRLRGIDVGQVESLIATPDLRRIELTLRIAPEADTVAREGTEFWIERPQVSVTQVRGLDTVVGAKYVAVEPGLEDGPPARTFVGRESPPTSVEQLHGVEFSLESDARYGLQVGSPVV